MEKHPPSRFSPGFRISVFDALILAAGLIGVLVAARHTTETAVLIGLPILHFFLFCNVFRIARRPELLWAASYLVSSIVALRTGHVCTAIFIGYNLMVAAVLIAREMWQPSYHGLWWRTINPDLLRWWNSREPPR